MEESFKLRAWTKADIPALAKYLNNKKIWDNCRDALPIPIRKRMRNSSSVLLKGKVNRTITASRLITKQQVISVSSEART